MKYRWKLLILLLAVTLPMAVFLPRYARRQMDRMSAEVLTWAREGMERSIHEDLQDTVTGISTSLSFADGNFRMMLRSLARRVHDELSGNAPAPGADVYWAGNLALGGNMPPMDDHDRLHWRRRDDGGREKLRVSWDAPVFWAPWMDTEVRQQAPALVGLVPDLRHAFQNAAISYLNMTVVLESGLHMVYPAQRWNPTDYDARGAKWYRKARTAGQVFWNGPVLDPATGQTCSIGVMPLHDAKGGFIGALGVYLPVGFYESRLVEGLTLPADTKYYLTAFVSGDLPERKRLYIVQRSDGMRTPLEGAYLHSADSEAFRAMLADMARRKSGVRRMPHRGEDCLWAYARGPSDVGVVFISSLHSALAPVRQTQQRIASLFNETSTVMGHAWKLAILAAVVLAFFFSARVTRPVVRLSSAMRKLGQGRFDTRVDVRSCDEFGEMARTFNTVAPRLEEHMHTMQSLAVARSIQQNLLPGAPPEVPGMELAGACIYCDAVGGDYYDFVPAADQTLLAALGDVSGHGVEAALLMTTARAVLRTTASHSAEPAEIVAEVNERLVQDVHDSGRFMTLFLCSLNNNTVRWVRAGHPPPLLLSGGGTSPVSLREGGLSLGVLPGERFDEHSLTLEPGDMLLAYSDGLLEAEAPDGERFGEGRLVSLLQEHHGLEAQSLLDRVTAELKAFCGHRPLEDDVTLLAIRRTGR